MKKLLTLLFLIPFFGLAQEYTIESEIKNDDFTKTKTINLSTKKGKRAFYSISKKGMNSLSFMYHKNEEGQDYYFLTFSGLDDIGCTSQYDGKMLVMLENGEVLEMMQISDTSCESVTYGRYLLTARETYESNNIEMVLSQQDDYLEKLKESRVTKLRVYGTKYYTDIELSPESSWIVRDYIQQLKTLM